jgi:hypothetical protein
MTRPHVPLGAGRPLQAKFGPRAGVVQQFATKRPGA